MTHAPESARNFAALLKKISRTRPPQPPETEDDPVAVMVMSFLIWDSTTVKAVAAYKRLRDKVVDFNDLRVSMPHEIAACLGPRYPRAVERSQRLRAALRATYQREHAVSFKKLAELGKREVRNYVRSLDGITPYVADRVSLLCFDTHCIPVDERLRHALSKSGVCEGSVEISQLASWLARQVKAADAARAHFALQAWCDRCRSDGTPPGTRGPTGKTSTAKAAAPKKKTAKPC